VVQEMMWRHRTPYGMTWTDLGFLVDRIAAGLRADDFHPDTVCAIARGGLIGAAYFATVLDVRDIHVVRVRRTLNDSPFAEKTSPALEVVAPAPVGSRVLVVDDIVGTGATAEVVVRYLGKLGATDIRVAALARNHLAAFTVDYCPLEVDGWVVFPWESATPDRSSLMPLRLGADG
jgi:uncharacterized protein